MPAPHPEDLLDRYLAGELSAAEAEQVRAYLDADPGRRAALAALHATLQGVSYGAPPAVADAHADLLSRIDVAETAASTRRRNVPARSPFFGHHGVWVGAAALGVLGCVALWTFGTVRRATPTIERHYTTLAGQQGNVVLPDGSRAQLAPATTMRVAYDGHETRVIVNGEAFFTVEHRAERAFVVRTNALVARVLGTSFAVRQYRGDTASRLIVTDGRVALSGTRGAATSVVFAAGSVGLVTDSGTVRVVTDAPASDYLAWTSGRLVFTKSPARVIAIELGRMYGVELRFADTTLATQPISWSVSTRTTSLTAALDEFGALLESHHVRTGDVITLVPGRRASRQSNPRRLSPTKEAFYGR